MSVIGLDAGTSRVKAVRFDRDWHPVDVEAEETVVSRPMRGYREQDMAEVWTGAARVVRAVVERSPDPIDLVAVTAQGDGCWLVDGRGDPVGPALLWNDDRAAELVTGWQADGRLDEAFAVTGCYGAPGLANAQLRWLLEHRPSVVTAAQALLSCGSWIFHQLTGRCVLDQTEAANPFFDARTRAYDSGLPALYGIESAARLLPPTVHGPDRVAPLTSAELGLPTGTPVALAPYDVAATAVGTGVVRPGQGYAILGTTLCVGRAADDPMLTRQPGGMTLPGTSASTWLLAYATQAGTEVLDWAARTLGVPGAPDVVRLAARSEHPEPPLLLPYLSPAGERSPFLDPGARGQLVDLELGHSPADVARGVLDGLTLSLLDCLDAAGRPDRLALSGGGAASASWCQDIADATGVDVVAPDTSEVGARGAVLVGAVDAGLLKDLPGAVSQHVRDGLTYRPGPARHEHYAERLRRYRRVQSDELSRAGRPGTRSVRS